jgi:hypothetical protein
MENIQGLEYLIKFLYTVDIEVEQFENELDLGHGYINQCLTNNEIIPNDTVRIIAGKYGKMMKEIGFGIIEGSAFQRPYHIFFEGSIEGLFD